MPKPNKTTIREAVPLSRHPLAPADRLSGCGVCGKPCDELTVWREHDERDRPIAATGALVFLGIGSEHEACRKALNDHPRLYAEEMGDPGYFGTLCGPCGFRRAFTCTHPDLKANGGKGLLVEEGGPGVTFRNAILCGRRGRVHLRTYAIACKGRAVARDGHLVDEREPDSPGP